MTTGKTIALTRRTFVGKVTSLLFNMLSRLFITFLPRGKCLNFMAAVTICSDFGGPRNKVSHCFHWRRKWQPTPVFLPGESCGQWSMVGHSSWGLKRVGHSWVTKHTPTHTVSTVSPSICHEMMGPDAVNLSFLNVEF